MQNSYFLGRKIPISQKIIKLTEVRKVDELARKSQFDGISLFYDAFQPVLKFSRKKKLFCILEFYVKSISADLELQKMPFFTISEALKIWF